MGRPPASWTLQVRPDAPGSQIWDIESAEDARVGEGHMWGGGPAPQPSLLDLSAAPMFPAQSFERGLGSQAGLIGAARAPGETGRRGWGQAPQGRGSTRSHSKEGFPRSLLCGRWPELSTSLGQSGVPVMLGTRSPVSPQLVLRSRLRLRRVHPDRVLPKPSRLGGKPSLKFLCPD